MREFLLIHDGILYKSFKTKEDAVDYALNLEHGDEYFNIHHACVVEHVKIDKMETVVTFSDRWIEKYKKARKKQEGK